MSLSAATIIKEQDIEFSAIRAQGAGGQNVNKVSSAIHLRFDITTANLAEGIKQQLLMSKDSRKTKEGVMVIKAQRFRTQEKNRKDALARLYAFIEAELKVDKKRRATKPSKGAHQRRLKSKGLNAKKKSLRGRVGLSE